ncbi:MAG TPA: hypothetical protein PLP33_29520 [Leptospiraceae bacterium]|nr:hypothetical protein [Leptospiraceae bacterium]
MKLAQILFDAAMGIEATEEQLDSLLTENAELLSFLEGKKKDFSLSNGATISAVTRNQAEARLEQMKRNKKVAKSVTLV